jgi:DNA repair exonuclease SbcCD ATPase subunit
MQRLRSQVSNNFVSGTNIAKQADSDRFSVHTTTGTARITSVSFDVSWRGLIVNAVVDRFFSSLRAGKVAAKSSLWSRYKAEILEPLSSGLEIDATECENLLIELGKSEDDLRKDIETLQKRREWRQRLDAAKDAQATINASESQLQALDDAFAEQRRKYLAKRAPIESQLREASHLRTSAASCDSDLFRTIQNPDLLARMETNREKMAELNRQIEPLREQLTRNASDGIATLKYRIDSVEREIDSLQTSGGLKEIADNLLRYTTGDRSVSEKKRRVAELQERLEPLYSQRDELERRLAHLRDQLRIAENEQRQLRDEAMAP